MNKNDFKKIKDTVIKVNVPEWNLDVHIKEISLADRIKLFTFVDENKASLNLSAMILIYSLSDSEGNRIFEESDCDILSSKSAKVLDRLANESGKLNCMLGNAIDDAKKN